MVRVPSSQQRERVRVPRETREYKESTDQALAVERLAVESPHGRRAAREVAKHDKRRPSRLGTADVHDVEHLSVRRKQAIQRSPDLCKRTASVGLAVVVVVAVGEKRRTSDAPSFGTCE